MLFHAWNVAELDQMALPPCHMVYQFHVADGRLSCMMTQRSVDILLGAPFNWVGTVALQMMIAQQAGLELGDFIWVGGDVHLYLNHVEQAREQLSRSPRAMPAMRLDAIGYGAGDRDVKDHPNVLRIFVGDSDVDRSQEIVVLECEIDDMNPQLFGPLMDRLYAAGALDVFYAAVQMKKNRPGTLVTVLASPAAREKVAGLLFAETTTIGVRYQTVRRECLDRELHTVNTPVGPIRFKVAVRDGRVVNASPEFDDCTAAAAARGISIKEVQAIATKAWLDRGTAADRPTD